MIGGGDVLALKSVLTDGPWDYVALGHIHMHQNLNVEGYPAVVYSGSLERIDFGEEREVEGFYWVQLTKGQATWQFVEVAARPFITLAVAAQLTCPLFVSLSDSRSADGATLHLGGGRDPITTEDSCWPFFDNR